MAKDQGQIPKSCQFLFGGLSGMAATCFVHPMDVLKNRMQMSGEGGRALDHKNTYLTFRAILVKEGVSGIYSGLSAGLFRQATYCTTRLGVYSWGFEKTTSSDGQPPNFFTKALVGMSAGAVGAFVGTPAEVALIRMASDGRLAQAERRNYRHVGDALVRIVREEGFLTLWRGAVPTIGRAMVTNAAQLASYSQAKQSLLSSGYLDDNIYLHFWASMISGLVTTAASLPVDIAKTRLQNMKTVDGKAEYRGTIDVIGRVIRNEGFLALWKGFTPYYGRVGPHTVLTFIFLEQMNGAFKRYVLGIDGSE